MCVLFTSWQGFDASDIVPATSNVTAFEISGLPNLFGVSIYAFMCHHRYVWINSYSVRWHSGS